MMKAAIVVASAAVSLAWVNLKPAQAASFEFTLEDLFSSGTLTFDDSPLTGIGMESVELSQLENADFSWFAEVFSPREIGASDFVTSEINEPTFNFDNGNLTGIFLESSVSSNEFLSFPFTSVNLDLTFDLFLQGDTYQQFFTGSETITGFLGGPDGEFFEDIVTFDNELVSTGDIFFTTIEPVAAVREPSTDVPEPSTILGITTVLGMGTLFKRHKKFDRRERKLQ